MRFPVVSIAEDEARADDLSSDRWFTGTFSAHVEFEHEMGEHVQGLSAEAVIAWGRARAPRVTIRLGDSDYFSAGEEAIPGDPPWPPAGLPPLIRRRPRDEAWKDRSPDAEAIAWDVPLYCSPDPWRTHSSSEGDEVARRAALLAGAEPPRRRRGLWRRRPAYGPVERFVVRVTAPNRDLAVEAAIARCDVPPGWRAEPLLHIVRPAGAGGESPPADRAF